MALDKIVDSSVLDAGLKTIADAIREKGGTSSALTFPGGMAEAIAAIQAGGGGGAKVSYGSFTASEKIKSEFVVEHGLGKTPDFVLLSIFNINDESITTARQLSTSYNMTSKMADGIGIANESHGHERTIGNNSAKALIQSTNARYSGRMLDESGNLLQKANETSFTIRFNNYGYIAVAGTMYFWIAFSL